MRTPILFVLLFVLVGSAQAQSVDFRGKPYSTSVFSATFPAGSDVTYKHSVDEDLNIYEYKALYAAGNAEFIVSYVDSSNLPAPTKARLEYTINNALGTYESQGPDIESTIDDLYAMAGSANDGKGAYWIYMRIGTRGNRMWQVEVHCDRGKSICTQADANKFFNSIKLN